MPSALEFQPKRKRGRPKGKVLPHRSISREARANSLPFFPHAEGDETSDGIAPGTVIATGAAGEWRVLIEQILYVEADLRTAPPVAGQIVVEAHIEGDAGRNLLAAQIARRRCVTRAWLCVIGRICDSAEIRRNIIGRQRRRNILKRPADCKLARQ